MCLGQKEIKLHDGYRTEGVLRTQLSALAHLKQRLCSVKLASVLPVEKVRTRDVMTVVPTSFITNKEAAA